MAASIAYHLVLALFSFFLSLATAQISIVNGQPQFSNTPVATAPASQPTLIYNCAKLPAICNNVQQRNQLWTPFDLHFDKNNNRKKTRRNTACPTRWKFGHPCPEPNQPDTVSQGDVLGGGSFPARPYGRQGLVQGAPGWNRIGDAVGNFAGMMWTCDEWPAASIFRFRFMTDYAQNRQDPATYVEWIDNGNPRWTAVQKRDEYDYNNVTIEIDKYNPPEPGQPYRIRHSLHDNGTDALPRRQLELPANASEPSTHQQFELLPRAPPLPIIDIAREFMAEQQEKNDVFGGVSHVRRSPLNRRQQKRQCDPSSPCPDDSCCTKAGRCGFGKENCDSSVCISNCNATALCGRDSKGGNVKCPLNVCCSYSGYCGVEQDYCNGGTNTPCQQGFGSCQTIAAPSCGGNSAASRSIGYYQLANVRDRQCNRIAPKEINTKGLTHLYAAFATPILTIISPGAPDRGGIPEDTNNYVALLKEMRVSFGTQFGISIAIPASYWYLRWFKPKEMQQYVDWFGVMTYDLHGPWDEKVVQIGKVNMGLAYYARGYTVSDSSCNAVGCDWSTTSRPAPCTNFGGQDMMMELKWGNQWIGYDNVQTIAMKKAWASQHCFGGTMIWSVDFYSGSGSGDTPDGGGSTDPGNPGAGNPGSGSGNVYIDPSIYNEPNPVINCVPPCVYSTFQITPSIKPPPFKITNDPDPLTKSTSHPEVTRWITPPPYPYTYTPPNAKPTKTTTGGGDDDDDLLGWFPIPTWRPGKPGPICKSKCGKPCLIFCNRPCLLDCIDGTNDFSDPKNPKPPPKPKPDPKPPPKPKPTFPPTAEPTRKPNPDGDEPNDEEEEDNDRECAIEFDLPIPTFRPDEPDPTKTVAPAPPPPTSSPPPPPEPPKPNPKTEKVNCYNSGATVTRGMMIDALNAFCDWAEGTVLDASKPNTLRTMNNEPGFGAHCMCCDLGCFDMIHISLTVINGCKFTVGGKGNNQECGRILRRAIDECDESSTEFKQGGTIESNCAQWRIDPNVYWG
ncbi:glycoside hydrolase family 18 protein [Amniculicola lignicola CBS 123094]|uniref:chitinase n=1 Tax=Amniculicola lignicola CBS 123094 TaxID=1392246 RepID=A0A6A5W558_9PLEO|nr:glycoside hydrolase family 18 protein [Amniculicola lignicola CBS 123094]